VDGKHIPPAQWVSSAIQKYGDKFLAVYRWDEPGGDQLDHSKYQEVKNAFSYSDAATQYVNVLKEPVQYYQNTGAPVLTADYGLYWFDYKAGYDAVLAEFGWNNSREQQMALVRGAARAKDKDWGAIVTWTYSNFTGSPFIESAPQLYNDLVLAYNNGAKYAVVFDYPKIATAKYGILLQDHRSNKKLLELRGKQCAVKRRLQKHKKPHMCYPLIMVLGSETHWTAFGDCGVATHKHSKSTKP
jgi:hypothetical protein